jgi:hypothetical protein
MSPLPHAIQGLSHAQSLGSASSRFLIPFAVSVCPLGGDSTTQANKRRICYNPTVMARRPRPPDEVLSRTDLTELQRRLSMMSVTAVQDFYRSTYFVCRIGPGHFPSARAIQELVQAWKQMRKWR